MRRVWMDNVISEFGGHQAEFTRADDSEEKRCPLLIFSSGASSVMPSHPLLPQSHAATKASHYL
ncbi:hypothetical protein NC652_024993 [Populus alba x Populus x berolinensis]|nr:hypothetical protein NC652_024993 [Populus alba x Populus x berolinensis]